MADAARARKVADRIHETVARLLQGRIKDPRLGFVTVTDVRVTGDLQQATVFYTVYGSDEEREETAKALRSAKGLIRSEVGKALGIRCGVLIALLGLGVTTHSLLILLIVAVGVGVTGVGGSLGGLGDLGIAHPGLGQGVLEGLGGGGEGVELEGQ